VTFIFRRARDPEAILEHWRAIKETASRIIVSHHGTISHQHGVGVDHAPYLPAEKGLLGMTLLNAAKDAIDPDGLLNPGKLLGASTLSSN
jgi:alkyldihydroxyacetonephosphate synthase